MELKHFFDSVFPAPLQLLAGRGPGFSEGKLCGGQADLETFLPVQSY